jgi:hypothetical protein
VASCFLSHTQIADAGSLGALAGSLEMLDLRRTQVTDAAPLAALSELRMLDLRYTAIADVASLGVLRKRGVLVRL